MGPIANVAIGGFHNKSDDRPLRYDARVGALRTLLRMGVPLAASSIDPVLQSNHPELQGEGRPRDWVRRVASNSNDVKRWQDKMNQPIIHADSESSWSQWLGRTIVELVSMCWIATMAIARFPRNHFRKGSSSQSVTAACTLDGKS